MESITLASDRIEQDTADSEDIVNILEFILPTGVPDCQQLSLSFNKRLIDGWVKQPSPCCAAAAVAGAWNCLSNVKRNNPLGLNHSDILSVYISMFEDLIRKKKESFERRLGGSMELFLELLFHELAAGGYYLKVQKPKPIKREALKQLLLRMTLRYHKEVMESAVMTTSQESEQTQNESSDINISASVPLQQHPLECMYHLFGVDVMNEYALSPAAVVQANPDIDITSTAYTDATAISAAVVVIENEDVDDEKDAEEDEEEEDVVVIKKKVVSATTASNTNSSSTGSKFPEKVKKSVAKPWNWIGDVISLLRTMSGLDRLTFSEKPSTTAIGNWGLLQGVPLLAEYTGVGSLLTIRLFMGGKIINKNNSDYVTLSRKDSGDIIRQQWDSLRSEFLRPDCVLLYHLKNHYALIYAIREWYIPYDSTAVSTVENSDGNVNNTIVSNTNGQYVRQILTARKGQRPTVWIDFDEVRETLLGWDGYKIMSIRASNTSNTSSSSSTTSGMANESTDVMTQMRSGKELLIKWQQEVEDYRKLMKKVAVLGAV